MKAKLKELNVAIVEIDVDEVPDAWDYLFQFKRSSIPVNLIFPADMNKPPILFDGPITQGAFIEGLDNASS